MNRIRITISITKQSFVYAIRPFDFWKPRELGPSQERFEEIKKKITFWFSSGLQRESTAKEPAKSACARHGWRIDRARSITGRTVLFTISGELLLLAYRIHPVFWTKGEYLRVHFSIWVCAVNSVFSIESYIRCQKKLFLKGDGWINFISTKSV